MKSIPTTTRYNPWNNTPVVMLSRINLIFVKIISFLSNANKKKPIVTIPNLKASAAKGEAF